MVASIETTLELWASSLRDVKGRIRPLFTQERVALSAGQLLDGLLGGEQRKTGWSRAEAASDPGPWRQQAILGRGRWEADVLRDVVRDYVVERLADDDAVLVIDETEILKQSKASCGVSRQYTGSAGKITDCQIGVLADYVSRHSHAFIDRSLYLPKSWTADEDRLAKVHVPSETSFATKPQIAQAMVARAIAAGVPFRWVAADSVYGVGAFEMALRRAGKGYVLGVNRNSEFHSWGKAQAINGSAEVIAAELGEADWKRLSAGDGTKGPRLCNSQGPPMLPSSRGWIEELGRFHPDRSWMRAAAGIVRVCRMSSPCLRAVESTERRMAKVSAPAQVRKPPEIFIFTFIMRMSCSA